MHSKTAVMALAASAAGVAAQRPSATPICDYYTTALLKNNTAENQYTLLTLLVNTVVIGNYSDVNVGVAVPGILAAGKFNGADVNLLPYFNGELASTNIGGDTGAKVNFLDGGGAEPLKENKPANSETSRQYFLLTHLYQFFGSLLGCSEYGMPGFPPYGGDASMYEVHKFMNLDPSEVGYFIQQVALAAQSFGVAEDDIKVVGTALNTLFNVRCAPPAVAIAAQGPQLQSICIEESCPLAANSSCGCYEDGAEEDDEDFQDDDTCIAPGQGGSGSGSGSGAGSNSTGIVPPGGSPTKSTPKPTSGSGEGSNPSTGGGSTPGGGQGSGSGSGSDSGSGSGSDSGSGSGSTPGAGQSSTPEPVPAGAAVYGANFALAMGGLAAFLL